MALPRSRPPRGQHFLEDDQILSRIADVLPIDAGSMVVEIGAGQGALTRHLLARGARVSAIEIEPRFAAQLRRMASEPSLQVIERDVLDLDLRQLIRERSTDPVLMAGNLPYYITSPILRRLFAAAEHISEAVLLMQKEVALRVVARKGSRDYGYLSVMCRLYSEPQYLFTVPRGAFRPPPQVTSAVVRLVINRDAEVDEAFVDFLKQCFRAPRKTLLNNLSARFERAKLARWEQCRLRAQQLDLEELRQLWEGLNADKEA